MQSSNRDLALNTFAIQSFRDTADREYVLGRLAYQARLIPQFFWCSIHSLEKYAKGILLLNRIPAKKLKHEVSAAFSLISTKGSFPIELSSETADFISWLESGVASRYFEVSYSNRHVDIIRLDRAVSEIRRYCQVLNCVAEVNGRQQNILKAMLALIRDAETDDHKNTCIVNGWLEAVLKDRRHPARKALVWNNLYFGPSHRTKIKLARYVESAYAPIALHPEILDDALKYVRMSKAVVSTMKLEFSRAQDASAAC